MRPATTHATFSSTVIGAITQHYTLSHNTFIFDEGNITAQLIDLAISDAQDALRMLSEVPNLDATSKNALSDFISLAPAFEDATSCPSPATGDTGIDPTCTDSGPGSAWITCSRSEPATSRFAAPASASRSPRCSCSHPRLTGPRASDSEA